MGRFVSVRGWLELSGVNDELTLELLGLKRVVESIISEAENYGLTVEEAEFYMQGWIFPEQHINWTKYIFYGADIRLQYLNFIKATLQGIAQTVRVIDGEYVDYIKGMVFVDDEDSEVSLLWEIAEGQLMETPRQ